MRGTSCRGAADASLASRNGPIAGSASLIERIRISHWVRVSLWRTLSCVSPQSLSYRWWVVGALCVTETVTWGIIYYGYPVFLHPMEQDLGASRVAVTGAFSLGLAVSALAAVPVGR